MEISQIIKRVKRVFVNDSKSVDEIQAYWKTPNDGTNSPEDYLNVHPDRSAFFLKQMEEITDTDVRILEIGCNAGRNLNSLYKAGYKNLTGIEISGPAIEALKNSFPEMASQITVINNSIEGSITDLGDNQFDLIFTMAVLEHIPSESEWIFPHFVRITKKYIITIEDEKSISWKHYPRNYQKIFSKLGLHQQKVVDCSGVGGLPNGFKCRVFKL